MKKIFMVIVSLLPNLVFSQYLSKEFTFDELDRCEREKMHLSISNKDTVIILRNTNIVSGVFVSGEVYLEDKYQSYVRITIEDDYQNEYLVYEDYPLLSDSKCSFSEIGLETAYLDNILVRKIKISTTKATIYLDSIHYRIDSPIDIKKLSKSYRRTQCEYIANIINSRLKKEYKTWEAGVTETAQLTFEEKKKLFGKKVPILYGFDFYKKGVFVMPELSEKVSPMKSSLSSTSYVLEWDWRNRHGKNWMTSIKNQGSCGSCWAFSPIGTLESYINLYYNKLLTYDLSEQEVLSCSGAGNCEDGGYIGSAFNYIKNSGAIPEDCFVYSATDESCSNQCTIPSDRLSFEQYASIAANEGAIKTALFRSPISFGISSWWHFLVLTGYKQIQSGENYFISGNSSYTITISSDNSLVGQTAWLIKNSWGTSWGDNGYGYVAMSLSDAYGLYKITGEVSSLLLSNNDIVCEDADNDGYYFWGIGPKPDNCPICCPDIPDGDDSDPSIGELDEYGNSLACLFPYPTTTINSNTTWNTNLTHCGNIFVTNGASLTITAELTMNPAAKITVQNGGSLIINGGSVVNANVDIQNSAKILLFNNGTLHLKHLGNLSIQLGGEANLEYGRVLIE